MPTFKFRADLNIKKVIFEVIAEDRDGALEEVSTNPRYAVYANVKPAGPNSRTNHSVGEIDKTQLLFNEYGKQVKTYKVLKTMVEAERYVREKRSYYFEVFNHKKESVGFAIAK